MRADVPPVMQASQEGERALHAHAGARILLAEDNPINQGVSISLLEAARLRVDVAHDGQQAIEMAAASDYDLVLMDIQMPQVDGLQATRAIRSNARGAGMPIVALTAHAFPEDRAACLAAGMNDHLAKPLDPSLLYSTLLHWLQVGELAVLDALADVAELDTRRGLAFFGGRTRAYLKGLATFSRLYGPAWPGVGDDDDARRRDLHGVGSACASVGATALGDEAHRLLGHGSAAAGEARRPVSPAEAAAFAERVSALSDALASRLRWGPGDARPTGR